MVSNVRRFRLRGHGGRTQRLAKGAHGCFSDDPDHIARYGEYDCRADGARRLH